MPSATSPRRERPWRKTPRASRSARQLLARQKVVAPFDGVVVRRWHNPGDLVDASSTDPVLRFADPARVEAEALVLRVRRGSRAPQNSRPR